MWALDLKSCSYLAITGPHMEPVLEAATSYLGQGIGSYPIPGAKLRPCFEVYREEDCFCVLNTPPFPPLIPIAPPCVPPLIPKSTTSTCPQNHTRRPLGPLGSLFVRAPLGGTGCLLVSCPSFSLDLRNWAAGGGLRRGFCLASYNPQVLPSGPGPQKAQDENPVCCSGWEWTHWHIEGYGPSQEQVTR